MTAGLAIDTVVQAEGWATALGEDPEALVARVLSAAARDEEASGVVCVLLADDAVLRDLNATWRGKDGATNVLSFPAPPGLGVLGDVALALETVVAEAKAQDKTAPAHTAHLLVHGFLHLLGYDHAEDSEAERMEGREREVLKVLGIADPYGGRP